MVIYHKQFKMIQKKKIDNLSVNTKNYSLQVDFNKENIDYFEKFLYDPDHHHSFG